ncbi:MBL fold metallo-hydrolase [Vibrio sp. qd031]|uniref:MBL fold metallo-hydrolase RNA specificity domain-containing protein n=1 Tax=Vibrio sp. qd031 TaxID=1603038 RepID=UPI001F5B2564|nr:MBL fold metallo-hydrolase [Vibrio sp. qd031]
MKLSHQLTSEINVIHHGAKHGVTGSCHQLNLPGGSLLVDCGRFQGHETRALDIDFDVTKINALIVTHAHIDHVGRIPWLLAAGYRGPIYLTHASQHLLPLMLDDALHIEGLPANVRRKLLAKLTTQMRPCDYQRWVPIECGTGVKVRFQPAGHILGSAFVEIDSNDKSRIVFSGDLGPNQTPLLPDPQSPNKVDFLFLESTYGNRKHQSIIDRKARLASILHDAIENQGTVIIPAFSVGRTQELLYDIEQLIHSHDLSSSLPIIVDSPMAMKVTDSYRLFKRLWGDEAKHRVASGRHPLAFDQCITIDSHDQHLAIVNRLASTEQSAIVVAASGMCTGGRVVNYLKALLPLASTEVLFCGYQAKGTLGSELVEVPSTVQIDDQTVPVEASIYTMSGYSAHADQADLVNFVRNIKSSIQQVHLIHGETKAKKDLKAQLVTLANVQQVIE